MKAPVHMAHHVHCSGNVLVEFWIWQILRHVVEEIDVPEGPSGEIFGLRSDLKILNIEYWDFLSTSAIILAQLLCWRGTITSSTSSNAIQSYLCKDVKFKSSTIQSYLCLQDFGEAHYCCSSANAMQQRKMQRKECSMHIAFHSAYSL